MGSGGPRRESRGLKRWRVQSGSGVLRMVHEEVRRVQERSTGNLQVQECSEGAGVFKRAQEGSRCFEGA